MIFYRAVSEKGGLLADGPICGCPEVDHGRRRGCLTDTPRDSRHLVGSQT